MNRFFALTMCSALSGLFSLIAPCDKTNDSLVFSTSSSTERVASFVGVHWQMADFSLDNPIDFDGDGKLDTDLMKFMKPCDLDNTVTFERNGTMVIEAGKINCDGKSEAASPKLSTWTYNSATKSLSIVNGDTRSTSTWNVIEASASYLKVGVVTTQNGKSSQATITWKTV